MQNARTIAAEKLLTKAVRAGAISRHTFKETNSKFIKGDFVLVLNKTKTKL